MPQPQPLALYNEIDEHAAEWLRGLIDARLIAPGIVNTQSICDIQPADLAGYTQVHFFAGIGGWSLAARLAGWPDDRPLWTGSCPCQALSTATRGRPTAEDMWPDFLRLITKCRPATIFGEQVPKSWWVERLCTDLDAVGYDIGGAVVPAYSVGKDHERYRFYFAAHSNVHAEHDRSKHAKTQILPWRECDGEQLRGEDGLPTAMDSRRANKGFGNAIVPQVAAEIIGAYLDCTSAVLSPSPY